MCVSVRASVPLISLSSPSLSSPPLHRKQKNDRLRELDLDGNPIGAEGAQALVAVLTLNPFCRVHL